MNGMSERHDVAPSHASRTKQGRAIVLTVLGLVAALAAILGILLYLRAHRPHSSDQLTVSARQYWQPAGLFIRAGDHDVITYVSGSWSYAPAQPLSDGAGPPEQFICTEHYPVARCSNAAGYGVPDAVQGSLVGRITPLEPLKIGDHLDFVAQQTGPLELAINDGYNEDNRGAITVAITVN